MNAVRGNGFGLNVITETVIGYILPEKPIAIMTFNCYGYLGKRNFCDLKASFGTKDLNKLFKSLVFLSSAHVRLMPKMPLSKTGPTSSKSL